MAEWGEDEFSGEDSTFQVIRTEASGAGQMIRVGLQTTVNGNSMAIQCVDLSAKLGKLTDLGDTY